MQIQQLAGGGGGAHQQGGEGGGDGEMENIWTTADLNA
jgi:hypothetical protein